MKIRMKKYEFGGFFAIAIISLLMIILFWIINNNNVIIRWFLPINNSLWEMGKLMFIAILEYSIIEYIAFGRKYDNFFFAKAATLFLAPIIFVAGSYFVDLIIGNAYTNTHILIFLTAIGIGQYISFIFMEREYYFKLMNAYAVIALLFMIMTFLAYSNPELSFASPIFKPMNTYRNHILYSK